MMTMERRTCDWVVVMSLPGAHTTCATVYCICKPPAADIKRPSYPRVGRCECTVRPILYNAPRASYTYTQNQDPTHKHTHAMIVCIMHTVYIRIHGRRIFTK